MQLKVNGNATEKKTSYKFTKLFVVVTMMITAVFFCCFFTVLNRYNKAAEKERAFSVSQVLLSLETSFLSNFSSIDDCSMMILGDMQVQKLLGGFNSYPDLENIRNVHEVMRKCIDNIPNISAVFIYDFHDHVYSQGSSTEENFVIPLKDLKWYDKLSKTSGEGMIIYGKILSGGMAEAKDIIFARIINSTETQKPVGVLAIRLSTNFEKMLSVSSLSENLSFILFDDTNQVVYNNTELNQNKIFEISTAIVEPDKILPSNIYLRSIEKFNWTFLYVDSADMAYGTIFYLRNLAVFFMAVFFVLFVASIWVISRWITVPLGSLTKFMNNISQEKLCMIHLPTKIFEVQKLVDGYNFMVTRISGLISNITEEQEAKRMIELNALQEQIKPHFMYNTFDAISSLIFLGRYQDAQETIERLGAFYRLSLSSGKTIITVNEEIQLLKNYLFIQKIRYQDIFEAQFEIEDAVKSFQVIKLTLQPIVENSIYHGIKPMLMSRRGVIRIRAYFKNDYVVFEVYDNGIGTDIQMEKYLSEKDRIKIGKSFGLRGTYARLKHYYGNSCYMHFTSSKEKGTTVEIGFKAILYSEEENTSISTIK